MNKHNAVIFDLDGTLVDSLQDIADALNHALRQLGCDRVDKTLVRQWVGDGLPMLCRRAMAHAGDPEQADHLLEAAQNAYESRCTQTTFCFPNILKMLDLLQSASIPLAVLSNKPHRFVERVIDALALTPRFVSARGYRDEKDKKPSPRQAVALADLMGVSPADTYFVGDSPVDIQTARNAAMKAVAVTWGFREKDQLQAAQPDFMLDDPLELISLMERHAGRDPGGSTH
jgi:phosphoglycolate phosphatase